MKLRSSLMTIAVATGPTLSVADPLAERDFDCHPSCATCRGYPLDRDSCLTCADGSNVTKQAESFNWGFCGEPCALCYDGLVPAESENTYRSWSHSDTKYNCSNEHAAWFGRQSISADDPNCPLAQSLTYLECGCPELPPLSAPPAVEGGDDGAADDPPLEKCPICADGSEPIIADATVLFHGFTNTTCGRLVDAFSYPASQTSSASSSSINYIARNSIECTLQQYTYYEGCGCPKPEVHEDACTLCYDGAPVQANYSSISPKKDVDWVEYHELGEDTCADLETNASWSYLEKDSFWCIENYNKVGAAACGCEPVPTPAPTPLPTQFPTNDAKKIDWVSPAISWFIGVGGMLLISQA